MRVYVPMTPAALAAAHRAGSIEPATAYAVTPALREWYASGDDEELEYAALSQAARASLALLAEGNGTTSGARRVVVACETDAGSDGAGLAEPGDAAVVLADPVPWSAVAAVHVDAASAVPVVEAAVAAWDAAEKGDDDAVFTVDACDGEELLWYATQEVADLLAELQPGEHRRS
jgi:hypothetical protein